MAAALAALLAEIRMPTYKITAPEAVKAQKDYEAACEVVKAAGHTFAARYPGSVPVYMSDATSIFVHSLSFPSGNSSPLWTRPQRDAGNSQRPRVSPAKGVKGEERRQQVEELKVLNAEWMAHFPAAKAENDAVLTAFGTDWGSVLFGGITHFEHEGIVYLQTGVPQREGWQEILNSEFDAAKAAHEAGVKARKQVAA